MNQPILFNIQHNCSTSVGIECTLNGEGNCVNTNSTGVNNIINANITITKEKVTDEGPYTLACFVNKTNSIYSTIITATSAGKLGVKYY